MPNSELYPELKVPLMRTPPEGGMWLKAFLQAADQKVPEASRPAFLRQIFRAMMQLEGVERLPEEEARLRRERFYMLLPESLRPFFPWETPEPLPPSPSPRLDYPNEHIPFRQYGLFAVKWAEALGEFPESKHQSLGIRLLQHLYQHSRAQGAALEEETIIDHLYRLSGERLRLPAGSVGEPEHLRRKPKSAPRRR
ncbi:MAG: hypothetical protein RMK19_05400 [Bacteroidia bacterium]|nr:hypothetical protein [Bacteroidia bacterium]MDW8015429.1 hypothetical protein [Bacteroidia bacterium]